LTAHAGARDKQNGFRKYAGLSFSVGHNMRSAVQLAVSAIACGIFCISAPAADASAWDEIRGSVYGTRTIADGHGIVSLTAPYRPEDMRKVPIGVTAAFKDGRTIKTVTFLIDENPTPVVAEFHMGAGRDSVAITSNFRVDRQSDVRAVVEASDGSLYMVSQLVKFAGGQASCSAPPQGNPAEIAANMGKMQFAQLPAEGIASPLLGLGKLDVSHPNHTGMVMDQQTLLYTPIKMVSEITVKHRDELIFRTVGSIALSQDPSIVFDFKRANVQDLTVTMKDTDGGSWTHTFPVSPQS
jgi:sulfur-oxidizing protein SoxY